VKYAALALLLAVPAVAQNRAAEIDFQNSLQEDMSRSARARGAVERAMVAMNDGVEAGGRVVEFIREKNIQVSVASQREAVKTVVVNGKTSIVLSDALPAYPRVYAPLIAKEAAALIYADMPACAERSYMRRATAGRVWLELGGEPSKLPIIEPLTGDMVAAVNDEIAIWTDKHGAEMALDRIRDAEKLDFLPNMVGRDAAAQKKLDLANARFVAFLMDERPARQAAGLR